MVIIATKVDKLSKKEAGHALEHLRGTYSNLSAQAAARQAQEAAGEAGMGLEEEADALGSMCSEVPIIMFSSVTEVGKSEIWRTVKDNMLYSHL